MRREEGNMPDENQAENGELSGLQEYVSEVIDALKGNATAVDAVNLEVIAEGFHVLFVRLATMQMICREMNLDEAGKKMAARGLLSQYLAMMEMLRLGLMGVEALTSDEELAENLHSATEVIIQALIEPIVAEAG